MIKPEDVAEAALLPFRYAVLLYRSPICISTPTAAAALTHCHTLLIWL